MLIRCSIFAAILALVLCLPISNLFIQRQSLASNEDPEFKAVSDILVSKCADCHTRDMAQYPFYYSIPIASGVMQRNIDRAQISFLLDKDKLSGKEQFNSYDVEKLMSAMAKGNMPPLQYVLMHWDSALSDKEQRRLVSWIQKRSKEYDIRPIPEENFFKPDAEKAELGKTIFNDPRISSNGTVSCASCHNLASGGTTSDAAKLIQSNSNFHDVPTVLNAAYNFSQYWDGRARDLTEQASMAIENPEEMNSSWSKVIGVLQNDKEFDTAFRKKYADGINKQNVCNAIAEYERTLLTPGSRFDKFLQGDKSALNDEEKEGFALFKKHDCSTCHAGPALGGLSFEKMGARHDYFSEDKKSKRDLGRYNVTHNSSDKYKFKVPTLRNIEQTAPYLHDGSAKNLEEAVEIMSAHQIANPLSKEEQKKVCAFLRTLTAGTKPTPEK